MPQPHHLDHDAFMPCTSPTDLNRWADTFSCYTAPLAVWLATQREDWWRPLLAGTPTLAIEQMKGGLVRFGHHPQPLLRSLQLEVSSATDTTQARSLLTAEIAEKKAVVICGDSFELPWQLGYRRWHTPHWFTVVSVDGHLFIDDPLRMHTTLGLQQPHQQPVTLEELLAWARGTKEYTPTQWLRETSLVGSNEHGIGSPYRWLRHAESPLRDNFLKWDATGAAALRALAEDVRGEGAENLVTHHGEDLWQALRQREMLILAGEREPESVPTRVLKHWQNAITMWRRIPPLLMEARMCLDEGIPVRAARLADSLDAVSEFEGTNTSQYLCN